MYSYQHRYHAGNFADLHKHLVLIGLLQALSKKETPFAVLDAYAGEGLYALEAPEAQKNKEYTSGIYRIAGLTNTNPLVMAELLIQARYQALYKEPIYAGSPLIIAAHLRAQDRAVLVENHPAAYERLSSTMKNYSIQIQKRDAHEALKALIPFPERRGLIFMDPSYERKEEYRTVAEVVLDSYQKFKTGIYTIWYPILKEKRHLTLLKTIEKHQIKSYFYCEWIPNRSAAKEGLYGSGMIVINPPWQLDIQMKNCFESLNQTTFKEAAPLILKWIN